MFSRLKNVLGAAEKFLKAAAIPISQEMVNKVLPLAVRDVQEIGSIRISIGEDYFDTIVDVKKERMMTLETEATVRFTVDAVRISVDEQWVVLRQVGRTKLRGRNLVGKIAASIAEGILFSLMEADPAKAAAHGRPGVTVEGDRYRIDLSTMLPARWQEEKKKPWMRLGRISAIRCRPGRFELIPELGPERR